MQVYRGFDIGTDKLGVDERAGIPHHLLDISDPSAQFTAADFVRAALEAAHAIIHNHHIPIIAGGTGLYLKALIDGLFPEGQKDPSIRNKLEKEAQRQGLESLWKKLEAVDPVYAQKIGAKDRIRIIRALEVYLSTSKPFSEHFAATRSFVQDFNLVRIGLELERQELYFRINERVDSMFAKGMIEEVKSLLSQGVSESAPPFRALGYKQVLKYLAGEISRDEAVELTKQETRRYAKRQMTWFKKMAAIQWFSPQDQEAIITHIQTRLL